MRKLPHAPAQFAAGLVLMVLPVAGATSFVGSATWVDNITRTPFGGAAKNAWVESGTLAADWHQQLSGDLSLALCGNLGGEWCQRFDGLSHTSVGGQAILRYKAGLGPLAPVFSAELAESQRWYREGLLDGSRFTARLAASKRWDNGWQAELAGDYFASNARCPAYDYQNRGLALELTRDPTETWQVRFGARRQWGEQMVYAWLWGAGASFPWAYGIWKNTAEIPTFGAHWYAYSMDATADSFWVSLSPAIGRDQSLPIRFEQVHVKGAGEAYTSRMLSVSYVIRF